MKTLLLLLLCVCVIPLGAEPLDLVEEGARVTIEQGTILEVNGQTAMLLRGRGQSVCIDGALRTTGDDALGVHVAAPWEGSTTLLNRGSICTMGNEAHAIYYESGGGLHLTNTGSIIATGEGAHGIVVIGEEAYIRNMGTIRSDGGCAVLFSGRSGHLELQRGSRLQGEVHSLSPLNLTVGPGLNLMLTTSGAGYQHVTASSPYIIVGQTLTSVDVTNFVMQADWVADLTDTVFDGLYQNRLGCCGMCQPTFWVQGIGSYRKRSEEGSRSRYEDWLGGALLGYTLPCYAGHGTLFLGIAGGGGNIDERVQHADTMSYLCGITYEQTCRENFLGFGVTAGYVNWEHKRDVENNMAPSGFERADTDSDALLLGVDFTLSHRFTRLLCQPVGSVSLRYAGLFFGDYIERGATFNLTVEDRQVDLLTARFELALPYGMRNRYYCWSFEPYIGFNARFQVGGREIEGNLQGAAFKCDQEGPTDLGALLLGFRGIQKFDCMDLFLNLEWSFDHRESARVLGEGGIRWNF